MGIEPFLGGLRSQGPIVSNSSERHISLLHTEDGERKRQKTGQMSAETMTTSRNQRDNCFSISLLLNLNLKIPIYFHVNHLFPLKDSKIGKQLIMIFRSQVCLIKPLLYFTISARDKTLTLISTYPPTTHGTVAGNKCD